MAGVAGLGFAVLLIGLVFRLLVSFLAVFRAGFNMKEKLFIPLAWLPKATVQVSITIAIQIFASFGSPFCIIK